MKRTVFSIILYSCVICLLLSGCTKRSDSPDITESLIWESAPTLNFGTMEYEKLKVEPWYCGRSEATGNYFLAETELGYYFSVDGCLYYADKADLTFWVPVCNQPDCLHPIDSWHYGQLWCNAKINNFIIHNGRIYFANMASILWEHYSMVSSTDGFCIASRALDGTDLRFEYKNESMSPNGGGSFGFSLTHQHFLYTVSFLNPDGTETYQVYRIVDADVSLLSEHTGFIDMPAGYITDSMHSVRGEDTFYHYYLDENLDMLYGFTGGELTRYDFSGIERDVACYLAGNTVRLYRPNDGYYDVDLTTREEVRVADAQLKDASSHILLPNCIIETTLSYRNRDKVMEGETHSLKLFNGEAWLDVQLPQELSEPGNKKYITVAGVTSDSILIVYQDIMRIAHLYRIPLDTDTPSAEYCAGLR